MSGECPCPDGQGADLCARMAALAWTFLGDDAELAARLAAVSRDVLVRLALDLADGSAWARQLIWSQLAG